MLTPFFFPNVRELLCILILLPIGSAEAEISFSCLRQIHSWLCTIMTDDRLGNLGVQGFDIDSGVATYTASTAMAVPHFGL